MTDSKKILIFTSEFPPLPGGIGNHAFNLALYLQKRGYKVSVITDHRAKEREENEFDNRLPYKIYRIKRFSFPFLTYLKRIIFLHRLAPTYDYIIASGKFPLWIVGISPIIPKRKKNVIIHGSEVNFKGLKRKITDFVLRKYGKIIAVSRFTKSLISHLNLKNIYVIPNGFTNPFPLKKVSKKEIKNPILITVGSVSERKGQINIIKALPLLKKKYPQIFYRIVGIPFEKEKFLQKAKELNVEKHIQFYGKVDENKKYKLLLDSDIFMMLSNSTQTGDVEGFGIAILEANSVGLPAVGSKNTGIEDAILHKQTGYLVNPHDVKEISEAIESICNNYAFYQQNALKWAEKFSWDIIIEKYIEVIEKKYVEK